MRLRIYKNNSQLNKGFSLVELIVSIAILSIVGAAIIAFFSMSMQQYRSNTNEASIQTESQLTWKRLESNILSTANGVWTPAINEINLYSTDNGTKKMTRIYYSPDSENHSIYYQEFVLDNSNEWQTSSDVQVFANLVTAFSVEIYGQDGSIISPNTEKVTTAPKPIKVKAHIEYEANGRTYVSDNTVAIRNSIVASNDVGTIYAN